MHSGNVFRNELVGNKIIKNPGCQVCSESFFSNPSPDHFDAFIQRGLIMLLQKLQLVIYASNLMML